jgi:hypothetical protein
MANNSNARSNLANAFMVKLLRLSAPASQKLEEEIRDGMFVTAVVGRDSTKPINSTPVLLEPLWARSTHVMAFRMVPLN